MASPIRSAIEMTRMLGASSTPCVGWMESVITSSCSFEPLMRATAPPDKDAVGDVGGDAGGAIGQQRIGGIAERAAGIDDVVDQQAILAGNRADDVHDFGFAGTLTAFVDDGELRVEALGQRARPRTTPPISGDTTTTLPSCLYFAFTSRAITGTRTDCRSGCRKALDLAGMQVKRQNAVDAGAGDHVGHQLGRDRGAAEARRSCLA